LAFRTGDIIYQKTCDDNHCPFECPFELLDLSYIKNLMSSDDSPACQQSLFSRVADV